jgi:hypothetical protein
MYPGVNEIDCEVAMRHHRELVARGLREQHIATVLPQSAMTPVVLITIRKQLGEVLERVGVRLQGLPAATRKSLGPASTGEQRAIAT